MKVLSSRRRWLLVPAMAFAMGLAQTGCNDSDDSAPQPKPGPDPDPIPTKVEFLLEKSVINVPATGGPAEITYTLKNPVEGAQFDFKYDASWLSDFNTEGDGEITFQVAANEETRKREAEVRIIYGYEGGQTSVAFTVNQDAMSSPEEATIEIEIVDATPMLLSVRYTPSDNALLYVPMVVEQEHFDSLGSDEAVFADDMEYLGSMAAQYGLTLEEYLLQYLCTSGEQLVQFKNPSVNVPYYAYAYGISEQGELLTEIFKVPVVIEPSGEISDCTFSYEVAVDAYNVDVTVTPSDHNASYFSNVVTTEFLADFGATPEQQIPAQIAYMLSHYQEEFQMSPTEFMAEYGHKGVYTSHQSLDPEEEYVVYAVVFDDMGFVVSDVSYKIFETERRDPNDFSVSFELTSLSATEASITATPSDETVRYYWDIAPATMSEEDILNKYEEDALAWGYSGKEELLYYKGRYGADRYPYSGLTPGTEYNIYSISMDDQTGDLGTFAFGGNFTTLGGTTNPLLFKARPQSKSVRILRTTAR